MREPIYDICAYCGEPIIAEHGIYEGQYYLEVPEGSIHYDCLWEWAKENRREAAAVKESERVRWYDWQKE